MFFREAEPNQVKFPYASYSNLKVATTHNSSLEERNLFILLCGQLPWYFCLPHLCQHGIGSWVWGVSRDHGKMRSKVSRWEGGEIPTYPFSWELEQYKHHWTVRNTAGEDKWSVLWIFWWQDSYSLHFYAAPAACDSLAETTTTKITCSAFCAVFAKLWFEVIDGEKGKARLAERSLAETCLMVFWPCNLCWRLNGPRESATHYGRAVSKGRAETREAVPAWPPAQLQVQCMYGHNIKRSHTAWMCVCVCLPV